MARWLLKTEPDSYGWDDLVREKKTIWNGVTNAMAPRVIITRTLNPALANNLTNSTAL